MKHKIPLVMTIGNYIITLITKENITFLLGSILTCVMIGYYINAWRKDKKV
jgi:hypothetical protein